MLLANVSARLTMLIDARDPAVELTRETQVLIVGAGPVGLTLAEELADIVDVLLIESGGLEQDPKIDAINAGETIGANYPLEETRTRRLGGSLALWAGWIAPFDAHDFQQRAWVPNSGWPFGRETLEPYFAKSAHRLNLLDPSFDVRELARACEIPLPLDDGVVTPGVWRFGSPTWRFGEADRVRLTSSRGPTVLTHASVVDLRLQNNHDEIKDVAIRTLEGREGKVSADVVVLACGGLETARLLLNANRQKPAGLGNSSGLLGRFFMEHPHLTFESLLLQRPDLLPGTTERRCDGGGREFVINFGLAPEVQKAAQLLNGRAHIYRTPAMSYDELPKVGLFMEQAPNPASRITLSDQRDCLGLRRLILDWQLCELDWSTYRQTQEVFIEFFEQMRAGCRIGKQSAAVSRVAVLHSNHHLGTTRMSECCDEGVVNANCRVHDVENLYLIGGNVFPNVSWANPTFTVIAMTYRLADYLRSMLCNERNLQRQQRDARASGTSAARTESQAIPVSF
jgi:choline dehydrogenase-like flavoprotein